MACCDYAKANASASDYPPAISPDSVVNIEHPNNHYPHGELTFVNVVDPIELDSGPTGLRETEIWKP